jgi:hypothetical protein
MSPTIIDCDPQHLSRWPHRLRPTTSRPCKSLVLHTVRRIECSAGVASVAVVDMLETCQFADSPPFDDYGCDVPLVESPDLASVQTTARGIAAYDVSGMEVPPLIGHEQAAAYLSPRNFSRANLTGYKDVTSLSPYSQVFPPQCSHVRAVRAFLCEFSNLKTATLYHADSQHLLM